MGQLILTTILHEKNLIAILLSRLHLSERSCNVLHMAFLYYIVLWNVFYCCHVVREELRELSKDFDKSEEDLKSLQSGVGQIVGEVLRQLTEEKCK